MPKKIVQSIQRVLKLLCLPQDVVLEARKERYIKGFEV